MDNKIKSFPDFDRRVSLVLSQFGLSKEVYSCILIRKFELNVLYISFNQIHCFIADINRSGLLVMTTTSKRCGDPVTKEGEGEGANSQWSKNHHWNGTTAEAICTETEEPNWL